MNLLEKNIRQSLNETDLSPYYFEARCDLLSDPSDNLTDILTELRSVEGITIVTVLEPALKQGPTKEKTVLRIKFLVGKGHSFNSFRKLVQRKVTLIKGAHSLRIKQIFDINQNLVYAG
tara:strand:+ start:307 stop:663 length:357 start_codon:yes stop_codon:yes gene_type:complete